MLSSHKPWWFDLQQLLAQPLPWVFPQTPASSATLTLPLPEPTFSWLCRLSLGLRIMLLHHSSFSGHLSTLSLVSPAQEVCNFWWPKHHFGGGVALKWNHYIRQDPCFHRGSRALRKWECSCLFLFSAKTVTLDGFHIGLVWKPLYSTKFKCR